MNRDLGNLGLGEKKKNNNKPLSRARSSPESPTDAHGGPWARLPLPAGRMLQPSSRPEPEPPLPGGCAPAGPKPRGSPRVFVRLSRRARSARGRRGRQEMMLCSSGRGDAVPERRRGCCAGAARRWGCCTGAEEEMLCRSEGGDAVPAQQLRRPPGPLLCSPGRVKTVRV